MLRPLCSAELPGNDCCIGRQTVSQSVQQSYHSVRLARRSTAVDQARPGCSPQIPPVRSTVVYMSEIDLEQCVASLQEVQVLLRHHPGDTEALQVWLDL